MDGYVNPYNRRPYSGMLSATQGFLDAYMQHQKMRQASRQTEIMNQYRQSLETERGLDIEYKRHRLAFAKKFPQQVFGDKPTQIFTQGRVAQTLGELESGGATSMLGYVIPFGSREDAINHALRKLGPNWEELAPNAREIIDRRWPGEELEEPSPPDSLKGAGAFMPFGAPSQVPGLQEEPPPPKTPTEPGIDIDALRKQAADYLKFEPEVPPYSQTFWDKIGTGLWEGAGKTENWLVDKYEGWRDKVEETISPTTTAPVAEPEPKRLFERANGLFGRATDWIKSRTEYRGPAGLFPSKAVAPAETETLAKELEKSLNLTPERALEVAAKKLAYDYEAKQQTARKGRIRSWVVPFNLKYGKRLQPSVLDEMADETIDKLSRLSPDRLETALQAILNGASEQELLAALALEE